MNTKVISAHVPEKLADKVDPIAARLERSRDWIIKQAWRIGSDKKKSAGV
ncbi:MAG: ribbon-helix-helix domain-containing protein [Methylobacter sp.]|uniref:Ribbon-helix-helix domain-containing protein n=1 Tax=Candidatus Methylobacter titanis TaxID=3053457 RepID=A0AA43TLG6_9GAMM|nr:ribbon-helix-helix domain-containing protein [Candidatus Methylobacter titanis]